MDSDIKRIVLVGSLQDMVRTVVRWLKRLRNSVVMCKHIRCAAHILT